MCKMASFIVTKQKVYWSEKTDSHEEIIKEFGMKEQNVRNEYIFVRVEIAPADGDYRTPIKKWAYKLDETDINYLPKWYDAKSVEKRCRVALKDWYKACVVPANKTLEKSTGNLKIVFGTVGSVSGNGTVKYVCGNGTVESVYGDGTVGSVSDNGTVEYVYDNGTVEYVSDNGTVEYVSDNGTVGYVCGNGTVGYVYGNGTVKHVSGNGTVGSVSDNGTVGYVCGNGTVKYVSGNGTVKHVSGNGMVGSVYGNGTVKHVSDNGTVITYSPLPLDILKSARAVIVDRSGKTVVCYVGEQK